MPHPFLSAEWIAAAREIRAKYESQTPKITQKIRMNQIITGVPFADGTVRSFIDTTSGNFILDLGELPGADVTISTDYATARKIFLEQDAAAAMQAFMSGQINVQGDIVMLMSLQSAVPQTEIAAQVATEILAITA